MRVVSLLLVLSLSLTLINCISLPDVFYAETKVSEAGEITQHDFVWVDQTNERMYTVYTRGDDVRSLLYRGDLQKEFYFHDGLCGWIPAPSNLDFNLALPANLTKIGQKIIDGVVVVHYYVENGLNFAANYYIMPDGTPFRYEIIEGTVTTIDFLDFKREVNESKFDAPEKCDRIDGFEDRTEYHKSLTIGEVKLVKPSALESQAEKEQFDAIDPATLALIGKTAWFIIKENKAEANVNTIQNAVIPKGATWTDMSGWKQQTWNGWQWSLTNVYGATTVDFRWGYSFLCQGRYKDLTGKYIENAVALPNHINVLWGYTTNVNTQLLNPYNMGTSKNPIAGITMQLKMETSTLVQTQSKSCTVNLVGDCSTQLINCNGYKTTQHFLYF